MFDDILFEIEKIAYVENLINEDLRYLSMCFLENKPVNLMHLNRICENLKYDVTFDDLNHSSKIMLPRFITTIYKISPFANVDEQKLWSYLQMYQYSNM